MLYTRHDISNMPHTRCPRVKLHLDLLTLCRRTRTTQREPRTATEQDPTTHHSTAIPCLAYILFLQLFHTHQMHFSSHDETVIQQRSSQSVSVDILKSVRGESGIALFVHSDGAAQFQSAPSLSLYHGALQVSSQRYISPTPRASPIVPFAQSNAGEVGLTVISSVTEKTSQGKLLTGD